MADKQVSILKRDGTQSTFYSTYTSAIADAVSDDVIQIWADLTEQITLKNGVDIWIMPGVKIDSGSSSTTIVAPTTGDFNCNIYGQGIIKNESSGNCIFINNVNAKLRIECDYIENVGTSTNVCIEIFNANKFHLFCNRVSSQKGVAIWLGRYNVSTHTLVGFVENVNLNISKVESGISGFGNTVMITDCNGFIKIDEISTLYNRGHCFSHRAGEVIARIKKMTTIMNSPLGGISTVHVSQGTGEQKLILYFDEIINKFGSYNASLCIEHHQGTGIFIGRKVISISNSLPNYIAAIQISQESINVLPNGYLKINEIISTGGVAMYLNDFIEQITIDSNYIECNGAAVINSADTGANYLLKNAKLKNLGTSSDSKGIALDGTSPIITFNNVQIVTTGNLINLVSGSVNIKNYGLYGNKDIDNDHINLLIGDIDNFVFVPSSDLT